MTNETVELKYDVRDMAETRKQFFPNGAPGHIGGDGETRRDPWCNGDWVWSDGMWVFKASK